jgi:nitroreductase
MKASCYGNFITGASAVIIVTCDRATQKRASEPMWNIKEMEYSCAIAMENIMLAALTMDIGSCFISLHHGPIHNLLHLNESTIVIGGVMLGYIKDEELLTNKKHDLRSPQEIATYLD